MLKSILRDQRGVALILEFLLVAVVAATIAVVGYRAYLSKSEQSVSSTTTKTQQQPSEEILKITELRVKLTVPGGLKGLSYKFVPAETYTDGYGKQQTASAYIEFISGQLKNKPSRCEGYEGEIGSLSTDSTKPLSMDGSDTFPQNLYKKIGNTYYILSLPNGGPCYSEPPLSQTEEEQRELIQQAFKTLQAL